MNPDSTPSQVSRRTFLTGATSAAGALAVAHSIHSRQAAAADSPRSSSKRIGFVDYNLDNYHSNVFLNALRGPLKSRGWDVAGCTGLIEAPSRAWAEKHKIPYFTDDAALAGAVDALMILAPSNPEVHLGLCQRFLTRGKPTYVDKTFAPNLKIAHEIFAIADQHRTPTQTSSALRYTNVQEEARKLSPNPIEHMIAWGGGGSYDEYVVHPVELLVSVLGAGALSLMRRGPVHRSQLLIQFDGDRTGVVNVYPQSDTPFAATLTSPKSTRHHIVNVGQIFIDNQAAVLDFFESGKPNVPREETLAVMRILEAARKPEARKGFIPLES